MSCKKDLPCLTKLESARLASLVASVYQTANSLETARNSLRQVINAIYQGTYWKTTGQCASNDLLNSALEYRLDLANLIEMLVPKIEVLVTRMLGFARSLEIFVEQLLINSVVEYREEIELKLNYFNSEFRSLEFHSLLALYEIQLVNEGLHFSDQFLLNGGEAFEQKTFVFNNMVGRTLSICLKQLCQDGENSSIEFEESFRECIKDYGFSLGEIVRCSKIHDFSIASPFFSKAASLLFSIFSKLSCLGSVNIDASLNGHRKNIQTRETLNK